MSNKCKKIYQISCFILTILYLLTSFEILKYSIDCLNIITSDFHEIGAVNYVLNNLGQTPIKNIKLENGECSIGYSKQILGVWPGTEETVASAVAKRMYGFYSVQNPPQSRLLENEYYSSPTDPIIHKESPRDIIAWGSHNICIQRYEPNEISYTNSCNSSTEKSCGANLCVKISIECPITRLEMVQQQQTNVPSTISYQQIESHRFLKIVRDMVNQPIVNIEYSLVGFPCYSSPLVWQSKPEPTYPAFSSQLVRHECPHGIDFNISIIEQIEEYELYSKNGLLKSNFLNLIGYYSSIRNSNAFLIGRKRPIIANTQQCNNFNFTKQVNQVQHTIENHKNISNLKKLSRAFVFVSFFMIGFSFIAITIASLVKKSEKFSVLVFCAFLKLSMLVVGFLLFKQLEENIAQWLSVDLNELFSLIGMGCFEDKVLQNALLKYEQLSNNFIFLDDNIILFGVCLVGNFVSYIIMIYFLSETQVK